MTDEKLEECPFCNCEFQFHEATKLPSGLFAVLCEDCDALGPLKHTAMGAVAGWNVRSTPTGETAPPTRRTMEVFICQDCGVGVDADEDGCCATCGRDTSTTMARVTVEPVGA